MEGTGSLGTLFLPGIYLSSLQTFCFKTLISLHQGCLLTEYRFLGAAHLIYTTVCLSSSLLMA